MVTDMNVCFMRTWKRELINSFILLYIIKNGIFPLEIAGKSDMEIYYPF